MPRWRSRPIPTRWQLPASLASMMIRRCGRLSHAKRPSPDASRCGAARCWCCWRCCLSAWMSFDQERQAGRVLDVLGISRGTGAGDSALSPRPPSAPAAPVTPPIATDAGGREADADGAEPPRTRRAPPRPRLPPAPRLPRTPRSRSRCRRSQPPRTHRRAPPRLHLPPVPTARRDRPAATAASRRTGCNRAAACGPAPPQRAVRSNRPRARAGQPARGLRCAHAVLAVPLHANAVQPAPVGIARPVSNACVLPIASTDAWMTQAAIAILR